MSTKLSFPIKEQYKITQKYGENLLNYASIGLKYHNGLDISCTRGTGVYAVGDGIITFVESKYAADDHTGYGNMVGQLSSIDRPNAFYDVVYGHLLSVVVEARQTVSRGTLLGFVDSTGFSTGDHLHFGVRVVERRSPQTGEISRPYLDNTFTILDYHNGVYGYIDPEPLFETIPQTEVYNVDLRYGQEYSWVREQAWAFRYNEEKVRQRAYAKGYGPIEFGKMKNAFIYGYFPFEFVMEPSYFPIWVSMPFPEYEKRRKAGTLLGSAPVTADPV
jgi:murein DD-endopeptidase MepM/ murein hydrolase activator NlpD